MFSRSGSTVTVGFIKKSVQSFTAVTSNRFPDVFRVFSRPLTVLPRYRRPPLPGVQLPVNLLSRYRRPPLPGVQLPVNLLSRYRRPPLPGVQLPGVQPPVNLLSRYRRPPLPGVRWVRSYSKNRQMPKREQAVKPAAGGAAAEASCPVGRDKSGAVTISVHAKPGSKHSGVTEVGAEAVGVSIAAPPTDGEANTELIRYLAEVLKLKKSHLFLDKGSRSRDKLIRVDSSLSPEEVLRRLRQAAG